MRAPQLKEPWRKAAKSRQLLTEPAMDALKAFLDEEISVMPQPGTPNLPTLKVSPAEIIRHILSRMTFFVAETKPGLCVFAEIYGGVAQSVVSVNNGLDAVSPTDFDARFYIPRTYNDVRDFDRCRCIVEEFLVMKLRLALDESDSELQHKAPNLVRMRYYQKQVVIGGALSLLSVGDPASGKGVDLEFSLNVEGDRKYFDDANSFVIPLSLQHLAGAEPVHALTMASNFNYALSLASSRALQVTQPAHVVNGLALYAHALSDKGLTPSDLSNEHQYGSEMVASFKATCQGLRQRANDPLRYFKSFIRSHYPNRPMSCLAMVAQLMAELAAYGGLESGESDSADTILADCAELLSTQLLAVVQHMQPASEEIFSLLAIVCFVRSPGNVPGVVAAERSVLVRCEAGRHARLLRKAHNCAVDAAYLCQRVAVLLREHSLEMGTWKLGLLECINDTLVSEGLEEEMAARAGKENKRPAIVPVIEPAGCVAAAPCKPKSYAAAALSVNDAKGKDEEPAPARHLVEDIDVEDAMGVEVRSLARVGVMRDAVCAVLKRQELHEIAVSLATLTHPAACAVCSTSPRRSSKSLLGKLEAPTAGVAHSETVGTVVAAHTAVTQESKAEEEAMCETPHASESDAAWAQSPASSSSSNAQKHWAESPTTSTQHAWAVVPEKAAPLLQQAAAPVPYAVHKTDRSEHLAAQRGRAAVTIELTQSVTIELTQSWGQGEASGFWSQDEASLPPSPASTVSPHRQHTHTHTHLHTAGVMRPRAEDMLEASPASSLSRPLFIYCGLFSSEEDKQVVQLDQPLFRVERYDSDLDCDSGLEGLDSLESATGSNTPTSSASSSISFASGASSAAASAASDLTLETLVRSMLGGGGQGSGLDAWHAPHKSAKACKEVRDYRWELADQWANSGLQSFPAPWMTD